MVSSVGEIISRKHQASQKTKNKLTLKNDHGWIAGALLISPEAWSLKITGRQLVLVQGKSE